MKEKAIVKQLIAGITLLPIQNLSGIIYYTCAVLDFTILAQYLFHDNEIFSYMEHALHRFDKTKTVFGNHCLIDAKLLQPNFNYPKFHAIT